MESSSFDSFCRIGEDGVVVDGQVPVSQEICKDSPIGWDDAI